MVIPKNVFERLSAVDTRGKTKLKGKFTYLSWAYAWAEACKVCSITRKVYEDSSFNNYHSDGRTAWVKVGVTIEEVEHIDYLPILDMSNKSVSVDNITSVMVNKAIQRSTVKALALHGLGLNLYAGEDLPMNKDGLDPDGEVRTELNKGHKQWAMAIERVAGGMTREGLEEWFIVSEDTYKELQNV